MIWAKRSTRLCVPKSGEQLDQMAPMLAQATIAMTASGMFGTTAATRSPRPTPSRRKPADAATTALVNSAPLISRSGSRSEANKSAG